MLGHDSLDDGQAKAAAFARAGESLIGLVKGVENGALLFFWDALAVVGDAEDDSAVCLLDVQRDALFWAGVFEGIFEDVAEGGGESIAVSAYCRQSLGNV